MMNPLHGLPTIGEILESDPVRRFLGRINRSTVASTVQAVLEEVRNEVQNATSKASLPSLTELADRIARRIAEEGVCSRRSAINATGAVLHCDLCPPLAEEAIQDAEALARDYSGLVAGASERSAATSLERELCDRTRAEAGLVVASLPAAVMLATAALAGGREVVVARGDVGDIAPGCPLPELTRSGGAALREVGVVHRVSLDDYAGGLGESAGLLLLARPRDYAVIGAVERPALADLLQAVRRRVPVVDCLPYAPLVDLADCGLAEEPVFGQSLQTGVDLAITDGAGLVGGPSCGLIIGRREAIDRCRRHPIAGALLPNSLTQAALAATLRLYRDPAQARQSVPMLHLLKTSVANLKNRAERLAPQLASSPLVAKAEAVEGTTTLTGYPLPGQEIPTWWISLEPKGMDAERLAAQLLGGTPPIFARVDQGRVILDLRSVMPRQDGALVDAVLAGPAVPTAEPALEG
jgi:L-seryl-tRNA(Ser) seleniumtransferase